MRQPYIISTGFSEFSAPYEDYMENHYQVHLLSLLEVLSWYFDPEEYSIDEMQHEAEKIEERVKSRSNQPKKITVFQKDGKYLITENPEIYELCNSCEIDQKRFCYKAPENSIDFLDFLGDKSPSDYIKSQLTSIGAQELYPVIESLAIKLDEAQSKYLAQKQVWRELDKTDPKFRLEVYKIEKNYIPAKIKEFLVHGHESAACLPEYQPIFDTDNRITYLMIDIATNRIIDGDLRRDIEMIKYNKWLRKHPGTIDLEDMQRMELDDDDPNFLSWDDFVANNDEKEEGDDEYQPDFSN